MGMYWEANHGTALVLTYSEMDDMMDEYIKQQPQDMQPSEKQILEDNDSYEYRPLIASNDAKVQFHLNKIDEYYTSGVTLQPYIHNGKPNMPTIEQESNPEYIYHAYDESVYVLWSDKELNSAAAFVQTPYPTYEDLKQEFKDKLERYLPKDFDWDAHIGIFDFASYA